MIEAFFKHSFVAVSFISPWGLWEHLRLGGVDRLSENMLEIHQNFKEKVIQSRSCALTACWFWLHFVNLIIDSIHTNNRAVLNSSLQVYVSVLAAIEGGDHNQFYLFCVLTRCFFWFHYVQIWQRTKINVDRMVVVLVSYILLFCVFCVWFWCRTK